MRLGHSPSGFSLAEQPGNSSGAQVRLGVPLNHPSERSVEFQIEKLDQEERSWCFKCSRKQRTPPNSRKFGQPGFCCDPWVLLGSLGIWTVIAARSPPTSPPRERPLGDADDGRRPVHMWLRRAGPAGESAGALRQPRRAEGAA